MSYCRWSSDWFACDLYCYEDVNGGYTTHVAGLRNNVIVPDEWKQVDIHTQPELWLENHNKFHALLDVAERTPIGLPHDGESFNDPTLEDLLERVLRLRSLGYSVPDYTIENIQEEIQEQHEHESGRDLH